jgi:glycosyltransferase involved in cell wall biosynthesis
MIHVALITPRYPPTHAGGGEISARLLAEQLQKQDIADVTVYAFDDAGREKVGGVPVRRLINIPQYPYTLSNEIAYWKLRSEAPDCDVFHAYNMHLHPAVGRLSTELDTPAVGTINAYPLINWSNINIKRSLQRKLYELTVLNLERPRLKRQMKEIDLFLPLSSAIERVYREHGFEDAEYEVVPNMLDPSFDLPKQTPNRSERTRLLYVGYLRDSKGVRYLIDTMELLSSEFELKIVGDGPKKQHLERRATASDASERINFTGKVPYKQVTEAYKNADVFVHPGVWPEPFGRTILEAMQAGLPVVTTNVGGPAETVPQSGLRCEPSDPVKLAACIKRASERGNKIGAENARLVKERYSAEAVIPQFESVYDRVQNK